MKEIILGTVALCAILVVTVGALHGSGYVLGLGLKAAGF